VDPTLFLFLLLSIESSASFPSLSKAGSIVASELFIFTTWDAQMDRQVDKANTRSLMDEARKKMVSIEKKKERACAASSVNTSG
jgi:chemotaxis regulatin CheY-phosphate phosphatase CheZ